MSYYDNVVSPPLTVEDFDRAIEAMKMKESDMPEPSPIIPCIGYEEAIKKIEEAQCQTKR